VPEYVYILEHNKVNKMKILIRAVTTVEYYCLSLFLSVRYIVGDV